MALITIPCVVETYGMDDDAGLQEYNIPVIADDDDDIDRVEYYWGL